MGMFDVLGGNRSSARMSPIALAVLGTLAYHALKSKGGLGGLFGSAQGAGAAPAASPDARAGTGPAAATPAASTDPSAAAASGAAGGGLGGLLSGLGGGGLGSGLRELLDRFRQSGHEDTAQSWVSTGANRPIAAHDMEQVLGAERIEWLMQQTGLPKEQLLAGLSQHLPGAVDQLTPKGQVPTDEELESEIRH
jgi:uncharacterized protein YidB (DUF937 family)